MPVLSRGTLVTRLVRDATERHPLLNTDRANATLGNLTSLVAPLTPALSRRERGTLCVRIVAATIASWQVRRSGGSFPHALADRRHNRRRRARIQREDAKAARPERAGDVDLPHHAVRRQILARNADARVDRHCARRPISLASAPAGRIARRPSCSPSGRRNPNSLGESTAANPGRPRGGTRDNRRKRPPKASPPGEFFSTRDAHPRPASLSGDIANHCIRLAAHRDMKSSRRANFSTAWPESASNRRRQPSQ